MRMLDLFSGIGGFSLAAQWVWGDDLEIVGFVEIDKYCREVLGLRFPGVPLYKDVRSFGILTPFAEDVDLITGGFPCQDISIAGKGEGIEGERSGLWSEYARCIDEIRPRFALIENVPALAFRGLDRVLCDLAEIGYDAEWQNISAKEVGAWHKRERIWIVAYPKEPDNKQFGRKDNTTGENVKGRKTAIRSKSSRSRETVSDSEIGSEGNIQKSKRTIRKDRGGSCRIGWNNQWATEPDLGDLVDGLPSDVVTRLLERDCKRDVPIPRVATGIPNRVNKFKSLGNAIVPQVAYLIMQRLKEIGL